MPPSHPLNTLRVMFAPQRSRILSQLASLARFTSTEVEKRHAVIIGAGHNGLVCANYLAQHGIKAVVLENRPVVGGAAVTEEFHPGFRNSAASYSVGLLNRKIIRDLNLTENGLRVVERPMAYFLPISESKHLLIGNGLENMQKEVCVMRLLSSSYRSQKFPKRMQHASQNTMQCLNQQ